MSINIEKNPSTGQIVEVFGPTVEFLTSQEEFSVMKGIVPAGVFVPMHRHPDIEDFIVLSGEMECLRRDENGHEWITAKPGDYMHVPGNAWHAWRNVSNAPAVMLFFTTNKMERFFREAGRPLTSSMTEFSAGTLQPPTPEELAKFAALSLQYNYTNATPEENAAVGLNLSF